MKRLLALSPIILLLLSACGSGDARPLPSPSALSGLQATSAPWPSESSHLMERYQALQFPPNGDESYHIHMLLHVYVNEQPVEVPANIGISMADRLESPLHTHNTSGVIHIEAAHEFPFTLSNFFSIWGVVFTEHQLGGYKDDADGNRVQVYVNGKEISNFTNYVMQPHDNIVVAYGRSGSFPTEPPTDALKDL